MHEALKALAAEMAAHGTDREAPVRSVMALLGDRWTTLILLVLATAFGHEAAAQLPAAPQVVLESNPVPQQPQEQPDAASPTAPSFSSPTVTIQSNPGAAPAVAAPAPAAAPSFSSPTVTIQSNPGVAAPAPAAVASPIPTPSPAASIAVTPVTPPPGPAVSAPTPDGIGTTIFGEQEAPIGLYITPWKDDYAERGLDRPARLLDEAMEPIDPATFRRQIEYYETITEFRRKQRGEAK